MTQKTAALQSKISAWYWASRPFTLSASVVPVLVGTAVAANTEPINWILFGGALIGSVLIQVGTNLTDEYVDHRKNGGANKFAAPHKVILRGLLSERAVLGGMFAVFGAAALLGLFIVSQVGWPILIVGLISVLVAYFYSAGPFPLGDLGLGEITVFIFMGPLMLLASYYVQQEHLSWTAFWAALPVGLMVTSIIQCNNVRDIEEDRRTGKRTLARLLGPTWGKTIYGGLLATAYAAILILVLLGVLPLLGLLGLASIPWAIANLSALWTARERQDLNRVLLHAARLHGYTGYALAAGLLLNSTRTFG